MKTTTLKIIDTVVFLILLVLASIYHKANPNIFDIIGITAMIYVMVRNPDVNTVTLISIILTVRIIDSVALADYDQLSAYLFYAGIAAANAFMISVVIVRPVFLSRYGPKFLKNHKRLTMTHQDAMIAWLYFAHAVAPIVVLIEHIIRHLDDVDYKPIFFYNIYKPTQLVLAVLGILVLYFMTFEKSKEARNARAREKTES
ncbi:MAG: hypothetical protein HRT35_07620 [Algicola sp.]|nr:hypothetical protein [Algicola sp.]